MEQELESLFGYCKSKGYKRSRKEFDQELRELIEEIDSDNLSEVAGGNKQTKAAVAGLFSALSIASPFASAAQTVSTNKATNKSSVATNFNNYKNNIANKAREGVNYIKNNVKKDSVQDILIRYGLPVGGTLATSSILIPLGLLAKNKIANQNKVYSFYKQLLCSSYEQWAKFFVNQIKKYDTEWINYDVYKKHNMLLQRLNLSLPLDSTVDHESYSNLYNEIEKDIIKSASKTTDDRVDFDNLVTQFNKGVKEILGPVDDVTTEETRELKFINPPDLILFLQNSGHTSLVKELRQDEDVKKALETAIDQALGEKPPAPAEGITEQKVEDPAVAAAKQTLNGELNKSFNDYTSKVKKEFDGYKTDKPNMSILSSHWQDHHNKHLGNLKSLLEQLKSNVAKNVNSWVANNLSIVVNNRDQIMETILSLFDSTYSNNFGALLTGYSRVESKAEKERYMSGVYEEKNLYGNNTAVKNKIFDPIQDLINSIPDKLITQSGTAQ